MDKLEKNSVVHSAPGLGDFTKQTSLAYNERDILDKIYSTIIAHPSKWYFKIIFFIYPKFKAKLKNRFFDEIESNKIRIYPFKELIRLFAVKFFSLTYADKIWEWAELSFDKYVARKLDKRINIVHAYEHAALNTFQKAQSLGTFKVLEQVSQHYTAHNNTLKNQLINYPELNSNYYKQISKHAHRRNMRKQKELELADLIICNSSFTKKTLIEGGINNKDIAVIPLAFPQPKSAIKRNKRDDEFIFLCVGSISITKGSHILLDIWKEFYPNNPSLKLIFAGTNSLPERFFTDLPSNVELKGYLNKEELSHLYASANLLLFPTLGDGFGMVITEAMSFGLPVLTTYNSAGPDLIDDGEDGFLIKADDKTALVEKIEVAIKNPQLLTDMKPKILEKVRKYQWVDYRALLIKTIEEHYGQSKSKA